MQDPHPDHAVSWTWRAIARQDFTPIGPADLRQLKGVAADRDVEEGTRLIAAGDRVDRVLIVGSGEVELLARAQDGRRVMAVVRKGGVIADIPLLLGTPMPFDAVVSRRGSVCELDQDALLTFLRTAPSISLRWMRSIAQRLDADRRRLLAMMSSDLTAQVAFLLLDHAEGDQHGTPVVRLSHEVMAQLLGARRQSVSRVLGELRQRGLLDTGYRQTVLLKPGELQAVAGSSLPLWNP